MTQAQLEVRKERSENGALIASQTEEGFRVYAVRNPSKVYLVKKEGDQWTCTCPDFEFHKGDTTWRMQARPGRRALVKPEETLPVEVEFDDPTQGLGVPGAPAPPGPQGAGPKRGCNARTRPRAGERNPCRRRRRKPTACTCRGDRRQHWRAAVR